MVEQAEARALWDLAPAVAGVLREDSRQTRHAVWQAVCDLWSDTGVVTATQEAIAERASIRAGYRVARQTAGNHLRVLLDVGVLFQSQTMRGVSASALGTDVGRAGSYVVLVEDHEALEVPASTPDPSREDVEDAQVSSPVEELGHLPERSCSSLLGVGTTPRIDGDFFPPNSDASQNPHRDVMGDATAQRVLGRSGGESWLTQRAQHPEMFSPRTADERQQSVLWIIAVMGWSAERDAERELLTITRRFFDSGWSAKAVAYGFERRPQGVWPCSLPAPHQRDSRDASRPRSLWAVLTWRMREWCAADGTPAAPPVEVHKPRRGRPNGAAQRRRELTELIDRLPNSDPRRQAAYAELSGQPAPAPQKRAVEADSAVAALRARLNASNAQRTTVEAERAAAQAAFEAEMFSPMSSPELEPVNEAAQRAAAEADRTALAALAAQRLARARFRARTERAARTRP